MGATLLAALTALALQAPGFDTTAFATPTTRHLVERAMVRHRSQDTLVHDYQARIRYRLSFSVGRSRWSRNPPAAVEEQDARVRWQLPNDLRIDVLGRRAKATSSEFRPSSTWDRPWFVPRGVGDSVRIFSDDFPATGALHPLASTGPDVYRYALTDSLRLSVPRSGVVRLFKVEVTPRRTGPALVTGQLWLDAETAEVVRFTFRYVGTALWTRPESEGDDSAAARRINSIANRIVSIDADLEYGLVEAKYWMPYRQVISGRVQVPIVSDVVIPFQAVTSFHDYTVNTGEPIAFDLPLPLPNPDASDSVQRVQREARRDSVRAAREGGEDPDRDDRAYDIAGRWQNGRFELHRPSNDSLARYQGWGDSLDAAVGGEDQRRIREAQAELAQMVERLPDALTGQRAHGVAFERLTDALRYDRVQGLSLGAGYRVRVPQLDFTNLYGTVRFGLSDERLTGRLTAVRDGPGGRWTVSGYREVAGVGPFAGGHSFANTFNALFAAHDDADYYLAQGATVGFETSVGVGLDLALGVRAEDQRSVAREAASAVNDFLGGSGGFPPNPPIDEGTFGGASVRLRHVGGLRWALAADVLAGKFSGEGMATGRLFGEAQRGLFGARGVTIRAKAGIATRPVLAQSAFRLGGLSTVRGFDYGTLRGQSFWSAQADWSPLTGWLRPVLFVDAGQAAAPADLFDSRALVGAGIGVSLYSRLLRTSIVRFDLSRPISPEGDGRVRFDLVFQAPR